MAAVTTLPNGTKRVDFTGLDGKRRYIRLGSVSDKSARSFADRIQEILEAATLGRPLDVSTAQWLAKRPSTMTAKLVTAGLIHPPEKTTPVDTKLGAFADAYLQRRNDLKPASVLVVDQVVSNLRTFFGADREMRTINGAEADDFSRWLATAGRSRGKSDKTSKGLSPATIGKRLQWCSAIFRDAVRRKLIDDNPFTEVKQPKGTNPERQVYVDAATIERIMEIVPESEWKLLLSLSRYLGLRVPSEPFSLTWDCVDWERSRLKVLSPKTEVHGKSYRWVPILPEVRAHLDRVFAEAPEGATHILHRLRERGSMKAAERGFWANMNLRKRLQDLIAKAGFQPWPKLWHNLRASAQTDLANRFPAHVVCEWLGNSEAVAKEHYLQVTDGHFRAALEEGPEAHQKAHQGERETALYGAQLGSGKAETPAKQGFHTRKVAGAGFEPTTSRL